MNITIDRTSLIVIGGIIVIFLWFLFILTIWLVDEVESVKKAREDLNINRQINGKLLKTLTTTLILITYPATLLCTLLYVVYLF